MTTSQEHLDWLNGQIPPSDLPMPPPLQEGDPGPFAPESVAQQRLDDPVSIQLRELGDMAKRGINHQFATLALLAGYATMFRHVAQALSYLKPEDLEPRKGLREELAETIESASRAIRAQQPETVREAAE